MKPMTAIFHPAARAAAIREEAAFWGAGLVFTFALFFVLAHVENVGGQQPAIDIEDLPMVSIPFEPPPAPPNVAAPAPRELMPMADLDIEASDSPVKVAVVPPDIAALVPAARIPPQATVSLGFHTDFKARARVEVDADPHRVYQEADVDQRPHALVRVAPKVPMELFGKAPMLRVTLLVVIDADGRAAGTHIKKSSGQPTFDDLVAQTVKDQWLFSPAIRRGKKVKCLAEQELRFKLSGGSPFDVQ
jgi:TonB family protein